MALVDVARGDQTELVTHGPSVACFTCLRSFAAAFRSSVSSDTFFVSG
ncbi:hypothetical protein ACH4MG_27550 [Streptomyces sp. NPDC017454]